MSITQTSRLRSGAARIPRQVAYGLIALIFWPVVLLPAFARFVDRSTIRPPIRLSQPQRLLLRAAAYVPPLVLPLVAVGDRESARGLVFLVGFLSLWLVFILCQPRPLEQRILVLLMWFWVLVSFLPVLMMD